MTRLAEGAPDPATFLTIFFLGNGATGNVLETLGGSGRGERGAHSLAGGIGVDAAGSIGSGVGFAMPSDIDLVLPSDFRPGAGSRISGEGCEVDSVGSAGCCPT